MSPRGKRVAFGLVFLLTGTLVLASAFLLKAVPDDAIWVAGFCEIVVAGVALAIMLTSPPESDVAPARLVHAPPAPMGPISVYRGLPPPPPRPRNFDIPRSKTSARRVTLGVLAAIAFTAAAVPFALHLPRWIEGELVIATWWAVFSIVLGVVAYRAPFIEDDLGKTGRGIAFTPRLDWLSWLDVPTDLEGCAVGLIVLVVLGLALLGAWLVVELVAPAVFIVAYRCVLRALAKARAAKTHGDAPRSALVGIGWGAAYTVPLAALVAVVHALFAARALQ